MKLRRTLALMVALGGLTTATITGVVAQDTKAKPKADDTKKAPPKTEEKKAPAKAGGSIEIYEGKSGWRFRIKDGDDKVIAMPTRGLDSKEAVLKELENIKSILATAKPTEVKD